VFFYSCALKKQPEHDEIVIETYKDSTAIPSEWVSISDTISVKDNWLKSFNDPLLDSVVAEAIKNNFELQSAYANVEIAQQNVIIVASKMKPQVGLNFGYSGMIDDGKSTVYDSGNMYGVVSWEPDIWGKIRSQKAASFSEYEATALDYEFAKQSLAALTAKNWYLCVETSKIVTLYEQLVANYTEILKLVKTKRDLGKVGELDVAEASANLNAAKNAYIKSTGLLAETKRSLEILIGHYPSARIETAKNFSPLPPTIDAGIPSQLLTRRPDLIAAEKLVIAAFRNQEAARLSLLPSFSFDIGAGLLSDNLLSVLNVNPWMLTSGIGMSIPIYSAGKIPAQIKIANLQQQQAVANYGSVSLKAFQEVENNLMYEDLLAQRLPYMQNEIVNREEAVKIAKIKYELGKMDLLPLLQLQNDLVASEVELIKLQNAQLENRINLHLVLGGTY
jgi:NodT family efflux transporter outer membrane factor (OMF) lipoprotein